MYDAKEIMLILINRPPSNTDTGRLTEEAPTQVNCNRQPEVPKSLSSSKICSTALAEGFNKESPTSQDMAIALERVGSPCSDSALFGYMRDVVGCHN